MLSLFFQAVQLKGLGGVVLRVKLLISLIAFATTIFNDDAASGLSIRRTNSRRAVSIRFAVELVVYLSAPWPPHKRLFFPPAKRLERDQNMTSTLETLYP